MSGLSPNSRCESYVCLPSGEKKKEEEKQEVTVADPERSCFLGSVVIPSHTWQPSPNPVLAESRGLLESSKSLRLGSQRQLEVGPQPGLKQEKGRRVQGELELETRRVSERLWNCLGQWPRGCWDIGQQAFPP